MPVFAKISEDRKHHYFDLIMEKTTRDGDCWRSGACKDKDGYPVMKFQELPKKDGGKSRREAVHRVVYALKKDSPLDFSGHEVSHLCHVKECINIDHLSYEPHNINVARNLCRSSNRCSGHGPYKRCILLYWLMGENDGGLRTFPVGNGWVGHRGDKTTVRRMLMA